MPDFNRDLTPKINPIAPESMDMTQRAISVPKTASQVSNTDYAGTENVMDRLRKASAASNPVEKGVFVSNAELDANKRYREFNPTIPNYEDFAAYGQSVADKAANGLLKGLNLAGTTIAGSFGMMYGAVKAPFSGRLADLWDNEATRALDEWNTKVDQEYLPNYYTDAEKNAAWYSMDNWFKANFLFDKLIKNAGFAVGAMATGNIANTGLLKAGQALGKAAMAGATAAEASQAFKLFTPLLRNTARAFSAAKNVEAAAILEKEISSIADLATRTSKLGELAKTTNQFMNFGNTARRTAIAAYSSAGEASFEALGTAKEFREKLIQEHIDRTGAEPDAETLKDINAKADKVGKASFFGNLAVLSATEYIQLPKLLGNNYSASKQAANSLLGKVDDVVMKDATYVAKEATTKFGKIADRVKGVTKYVYDPKESLQEGLQYALQVGTQNYYNKAFQSKNADALVDGFLYGLFGTDKYGEGVGAFNSKEGMESMVLGGLTGGLMQIKGNITEAKQLKTNTAAFLEQLNSTPGFKQAFVDRMNSVNRANILQQQQQDAVIQGDKLEAKDIDADLMHNYLATRIKYGRFDMVKDDINDLRFESATEEGLSSLKEQGIANINDTKESFQARLATFEQVANYTNELYKSLDLRYSGVLNEDGSKKYSPEVVDKMVYAAAKIANYDLRIPQVNNTLVTAGINTSEILESIIKEFKPNKEATDEAIKQINELDVTSDIKDELKTNLSDVIEMSLRRKLFMQEYDDIKDNPANYELKPEVAFGAEEQMDVTVQQKEKGKKKPVEKELEVGKEYSLKQPILRTGDTLQLAPKITVLSQTLGGEFEVKLPNGDVKFLSPEQFKAYEISDEDNTSEELKSIMDKAISTVLGKSKFADITVPEGVDPLEHINSLGNKDLIDAVAKEFKKNSEDFLKQQADAQARRDRMNQYADQLRKTQEAAQVNSGNVATGSNNEDLASIPFEEFKKALDRLFTSTTSDSITWAAEEGRTLAPHVVRYNEFINKVKTFKNRKNIKVMLVTPNQEDALGLTGLAEMSFRAGNMDVATVNDPKIGFIGAVFIQTDKKGVRSFVDKDGNVIGEVGQPVDLNKVTFTTMPAASLYNSKGGERFRAGDKEGAALEVAAWEKYREQLFNGTARDTIFDFGVSKGIAIKGEAKNAVGGILIPENKIGTEQVVKVPTKGSIDHEDGYNYKFPNGRPVFQYGDTLEFLNNATFNEKQATAIYKVLKTLSDAAIKGQDLSPKYLSFLQNVLFWKIGGTVTANQVYIDGAVLHIGNETHDFANIANEERQIINHLQTVFHNVNNKTLLAGLAEPFIEFYTDASGNLQERTWKNYQSYLLASKNPDGSTRVAPLTTDIIAPTEAVPFTHEQKYAYLMGMELPRQVAPKKEATKEDKAAPSIYKANAGEVAYTYTTDDKGNFTVVLEAENPTIEKMAADPNMVAVATEQLKGIGQFDDLDTPLETVGKFVSNVITASLVKERTAAAPAVEPAKTEEAPEAPKTIRKGRTGNPEYRRVGKLEGTQRISSSEMELFKEWVAKNVPGIPYEFLDNIIKTHDGERAWGVFENGVAKIFKGAIRGTEYHEVFEGVFKGFLSEAEQDALIAEFKSKTGTFLDRASGKKIDYANATDEQAKERIADDFADFRLGKLPAKSVSEKIRRFFKAIVDFFKSFVTKPSLKEQLFKDIDTGEFAERSFPETKKNDAAEYRRIPGLNAQQTNEFVQDITARVFQFVFADNTSLFNPAEVTAKDIFDAVKNQFEEEGVFEDISENTYNQLVERTKEFLKTYRIEFDEDNRVVINDEGANSRDYAAEAFSVNFKKSSPYAVKLLVGTLIQTKGLNQKNATSLVLPEPSESSIGGYKLVPFGKAFTTLINKLSNTRDVSTFTAKLFDLAKENSDYVRLFKRLGGNLQTGKIDFANYQPHDWRLFISFYQVFTKQKPEALALFNDGLNTYTAPANQASLITQIADEWVENMKTKANTKDSIIKYDNVKKTYTIEKGDYAIGNPQQMLAFLGKLGVDMSIADYNKINNKKAFADAVSGIKIGINKAGELMTFKGKNIGIRTQLTELARLYTIATSPAEDSTYFNVEGKRQQSFTDSNAPSLIESVFNSSDTLDELKEAMPQLNDVFSGNSQVLKKGGLFFDEDGNRIQDLKVLYIQGVKDLNTNKGKTISSLSIGDRMVTEMNQNLDGNYYVLVPADGSTEWMMNLGNQITYKEFAAGTGFDKVNDIFVGYLKDEIALAQDAKNRKQVNNIGSKANELRFFKEILSDSLVEKVNALIADNATEEEIDEFVAENREALNKAFKDSIDATVKETKDLLIQNGKLTDLAQAYAFPTLENKHAEAFGINKMNITEQQLTDLLTFLNANYVINNIEYHKTLFGDPYQFKIKNGNLDETKRIKSFLSPRRITVNFPELNNWLNDAYNQGVTEGELGYHQFKDYAKTFTAKDVTVVDGFYPESNEADAASWITADAYREVKIKNGQWSDEAEAFHQWQMAYARLNVPGYKYKNPSLEAKDEALVATPMPKYTIEVLKPIVSGNKFNKNKFDIVLDKFSQMPIYFQAVQGTNLEKLYMKMFNEGYDYAIVESGRKVGTEGLADLYTKDGNFNEEAFNNTVNVAWESYGIQVENSYEKDKQQTRGSQLTKLATVDLYSGGKAIDESLDAEAKHNKAILEAMMTNGYNELLNKLGIEDLGDGFNIKDDTVVANTLRQEMLKREMSENGIDSISINPQTGRFYIPFEASTNYIQIKNILYSIVDKSIVSPKVSGFSGVQVPVTMWEKAGTSRGANKTKSALKFYTKEDPYMEVYLPAWFKNKLPKGKFANDEKLIEYLNGTDILKGIGFRIPTQALSSVEVFKIKGFLPEFMGKTVVVPSEITTKAGSDFDIDKLNMYLKNVYVTPSGEIKSVPFFGFGQQAKDKIKQFILEEDIKGILDLNNDITGDREDDYGTLADKLYKQSLENEYFRSLERLITAPENFDRLTAKNTDQDLKDIATKLDELRGQDETNVKNRLLDRNYMAKLRHAFLTGKKWVGIAAVNITGNSLVQKSNIYVEDPQIQSALPHNKYATEGFEHITLSEALDQEGKYISDKLSMYANAFVDVAKDPYILKIVKSDRVVGTFMFLERIGVPMETVAMFMNQPIISAYVDYLDSIGAGRSAIKSSKNIKYIQSFFPATDNEIEQASIKTENFEDNISTYYKGTLNASQNAEQRVILDEFLKYSTLADANFQLTQAINYDTTSFRNADDLYRKQLMTEIAQNEGLISSPRKILNTSFIGAEERILGRATNALGEVLKFNSAEFRGVIENAIQQYAANVYLSKDKFSKVAEKLSASFLDYIIQVKGKKALNIKDLLTGPNSVAVQLEQAKEKYPNVKILQDLVVESAGREDSAKTIKLRANLKEAYDENLYIGMMRELRDNPATTELYNNLIKVAIVQGTYQSAVSIKNIIPIEDYAEIVTPIVSAVSVDEDVRNFAKLNWFQRNNWNDRDIVPAISPLISDEDVTVIGEYKSETVSQYTFLGFAGMEKLGIKESDKLLLTLPSYVKGGSNDVIVIPRIVTVGTETVDFITGKTITKSAYRTRKAQGDPALTQVFGYQKVKYADGTPLTNYKGRYVYKMINLQGENQYASEYSTFPTESALNNNTGKVTNEIPNSEIIKFFDKSNKNKLPLQYETEESILEIDGQGNLTTKDFKCKI